MFLSGEEGEGGRRGEEVGLVRNGGVDSSLPLTLLTSSYLQNTYTQQWEPFTVDFTAETLTSFNRHYHVEHKQQ